MSIQSQLMPVVAITGSSIVVGCGGYSGGSCGSYGSYGSYGTYAAAPSPATHSAARTARGSAPSMASSYACTPANVSAPGIYEGALINQTTQAANPVVAIIDESGDGRMSAQDGTYYRFSVATSGLHVSGPYSGFSQATLFPNGRQSTSGAFSADITPPGMNGALTDQAGNTQALPLSFDNVYNFTSALPTLAGTWSYSATGFSFIATIQPDGAFAATDANKCSYVGSFGLIDSHFNAYTTHYIRTCKGSSLTFTGLATYFPAIGITPADIKILADDNAGDYLVVDLQ